MSDFDDREHAAYQRVLALFREVDPQLPVGDGSWTARDVLAHLCNVARRYTSVPRLGQTVREVDQINAEELTALEGLGIAELIGKFERAFARYREVWTEIGPEHMWPFHGGGQLPTASLRANWLGEMTIHGYDVASAAGLGWRVSDADAADLLQLLHDVVPAYARAGQPASVAFAADGAAAWSVRIRPDGVAVVDGAEDAEATVSGAGGAIALLLYQRIGPAELPAQGALVTGDPDALPRLLAQVEKP
jgi:uncharacterized protein (TIGR03083 family)